jgi:hypothetical protein
MTQLITFDSEAWGVASETANPINPIAGQGLLSWLREQLVAAGYEATDPEPEDWGWYLVAKRGDASYLIGASSDVATAMPREWTVQIHRQRSLSDRLLGRNKLQAGDPLMSAVEEWIRAHPRTRNVRVDRTE